MAPVSFLGRVDAAVLAFLQRPGVASVLRHAATAAVGVIVAASVSGGLTAGVVGVAAAAAFRVILQAVEAALSGGAA